MGETVEVKTLDTDKLELEKVITVFPLACITFLAVCGGPYGIEVAVQAAGAFPVLMAVFVLPFCWGMPQALQCAELSTMMDENGGYVLWVQRGLGPFMGFMSSWNSVVSNLLNMPAYIALAAGYVELWLQQQLNYEFSWIEDWLLKFVFIFGIFLVNLKGMSTVSFISAVMTLVIMFPFLIEPMVGAHKMRPATWVMSTPTINWALFTSTILWNYQGWDGVGCFAGEVKNARRTYPLGVMLAVVMMTVAYALPVAVGASVNTDFVDWQPGQLGPLATQIAPWLGYWVLGGALIANLGQCNVYMATSARALWAMGNSRYVPKQMACVWDRFKTPVASLVVHLFFTCFFMSFNFDELVILNTFFNNISLALESFAYIFLKYREPNTPRPYKVPLGMFGGWLVVLLNLGTIIFAMVLQDAATWLLVLACEVVFAAIYWIRACVLDTRGLDYGVSDVRRFYPQRRPMYLPLVLPPYN